MLDKDPNTRIAMRDILEHPWIAQYRDEKIELEWGGIFSKANNTESDDEADKTTSPSNT